MGEGLSGIAWRRTLAAACLLGIGLFLTSLYSFLLFHSLAEAFSIAVACGTFMVAWNTRRITANPYLLFLGIVYLAVAQLDLLHTLAYDGLGVFARYDADLPTQLWISARYVEALSLLVAPVFLTRALRPGIALTGYGIVVGGLTAAIFFRVFPVCYVSGSGLTPFKRISEYAICVILLAALGVLRRNKAAIDPLVFRLVLASVFLTILSELAFTLYVGVYDFSNLAGHLLKIASFYLVYKAVIETTLTNPYRSLFRALKQREAALEQNEAGLRRYGDELEALVKLRTSELEASNEHLRREISKSEKTEQARLDAQRELQEQRLLSLRADRLRSLGEMAAGIAHELSQPLCGVRGQAEHLLIGLKRGWELDRDKLRDKLSSIVEQTDRMTHIIEHTRMFAREARSCQTLPISLNDVIDASVGMLGRQLNAQGIRLVVGKAADLPLVLANAYSLEEVVLNLVANARDALETQSPGSSGGAAAIDLRTYLDAEDTLRPVKLRVTDCGVGIAQEVLDRVFEPFFTTKGPEKGTGLGLPICKSIVEGFGGTLRLDSAPGSGTSAIVSLPGHAG